MSPWSRPFPLREGEDEAQFKRRFAELWAKFPWQAPGDLILQILPGTDNIGRSLQAADNWTRDIEVLEWRDEYKRSGGLDDDEIPSKERIVNEVLAVARSATSPEDKVKAYKLVGELLGFVEKASKVKIDAGGEGNAAILAELANMLPN